MATAETDNSVFAEAIIQGKINEVTQPENGDFNYFELGLKAQDEYSMPPVLQVSQPANQRPFGKRGDIVTLRVQLGGYPRKSERGVRFVTNTLTFIEAL